MAIKRITLRVWVILALIAVLAGSATFSAYAATTDWTWTKTAVLPAPSRGYHTATPVTLSAGGSSILVVGGMDNSYGYVTSSQLYAGNQKGWAPGPSLAVKRYSHTATLLTTGTNRGKVLVAGGYQNLTVGNGLISNSIKSCELLDPNQNQGTGTTTGDLNEARAAHTATLLTTGPKAGQVLAAGGVRYDSTKYDPTKIWNEGYINILNTSELYADGVWTRTQGEKPVMAQARELATATLLLTGPNAGKVLVVGGAMQGTTSLPQPYVTLPVFIATTSCELYNPATDSWEPGPDLKHPRVMHTATLLSEDPNNPYYGKILVAGGEDVLWDPNTNQLPKTVFRSYEIYDPAKPDVGWICPTDQDATKHMKAARWGHTATLLTDGTVLAVSGKTGELYDPKADTWSDTKYTLWYPRIAHTATRLANEEGWVLIVGGGPDQCEFFQPGTPPELLPSGVFPPLRQLLPGN